MKRNRLNLACTLLVAVLLVVSCAAPATPAPTPTAQPNIKVGVLLPYTGAGAAVAPFLEGGIRFAFGEVGNAIAGRTVEIITEDETEDPNVAVQKARKLVEEDKVDVVLGPLLAHTGAAVGGYLAGVGTPHIALGASDAPTSQHTFYPGSGRGDAYPTGVFAYEDLGARTAAIIYQDYAFGQQSRDGFKAGFTDKGGSVVSEQGVPFGTSDMLPFIEGMGEADVVAVLLVNPSDFAFVKQYREAGLDKPVLFISNAPQEAPLLAQMGDDVLGMYGSSWYSPLIDLPVNKKFVEAFQTQSGGFPPGIATHTAYMAGFMYVKAVSATNGDTSPAAVINALLNLKDVENPAGAITIGPDRVAVHDQFIFKVGKLGENYVWEVVKQYSDVTPK